jgi:hypothetical protein
MQLERIRRGSKHHVDMEPPPPPPKPGDTTDLMPPPPMENTPTEHGFIGYGFILLWLIAFVWIAIKLKREKKQ